MKVILRLLRNDIKTRITYLYVIFLLFSVEKWCNLLTISYKKTIFRKEDISVLEGILSNRKV